MSSQYYSATAYVGTGTHHDVEVTIPLVGPAGPAGEGASSWNDLTGKPDTFTPSTHAATHEQGGSDVLELDSQQILVDSVFVSTASEGLAGIYLRNGSDNSKPLYENAEYRTYIWWDSGQNKWFLTSDADVDLFESSQDTTFPWLASSWSPIAPQTGTIDVDQAQLFDVSDQSIGNPSLLRTPKTGNATSTELVLGSDTRLTNSRTPTAHAASHATAGSDAISPADIGAAAASHTHAAADITSGVLDLARQKVVELVPCDDDPGNELDVSAYEQNGNIIAHLNLRADAVDATLAVLLPDLAATAIGEVTLRVTRGGQGLEFTSVFIEVLDEEAEQIFGTSEGPLEIDADEELTFRWNNGRWDMDLRPNPSATTAVSIFKPNASGTLVISSTTGITGADAVTNIVSLTQAEYNAIGSPDAATLYLITDP